MQQYEYRVVPAPRRGEKARGLKTTPERFAHALSLVMNEQAREGWEYLRADTLPCDERVGLTGKATTTQHLLVFRRALAVIAPVVAGGAVAAPATTVLHTPVADPAATGPRLGAASGDGGKAPPLGPARDEGQNGG